MKLIRFGNPGEEKPGLQLEDGRHVHGFLCEAHALAGAQDITAHGAWRAYLASRSMTADSAPGTASPIPATTAS